MFNALIIAHYNFKNDKGKIINTTKLRVLLNEYGTLEICSELANDYKVLDEIKVKLTYNENSKKFVVSEIIK